MGEEKTSLFFKKRLRCTRMTLLKPAKFFLALSGTLMLVSLVLLFVPGPKLSIDFTGGTLMEVKIPAETDTDAFDLNLRSISTQIGNISRSRTAEGTVLLRMRDITNEEHTALVTHLQTSLGNVEELQFTTIGPTVGATLKSRAILALGLAAAAIVLYIAFVFRNVPKRLSPWRFGIVAVVALLHDVLITVGVFIVLSHFTAFEFDILFVTALLTIIGYSVNDTIVIFDRIRESIFLQHRTDDFADVANRGLTDSVERCVHTSVSTLILLFALFLLGSESIRWFVLALIIGISLGTYSSLFVATPLLVYWRKRT